jgi:hypothetical protein
MKKAIKVVKPNVFNYGEDWREVDEIIEMVRCSRILVSGVVFLWW